MQARLLNRVRWYVLGLAILLSSVAFAGTNQDATGIAVSYWSSDHYSTVSELTQVAMREWGQYSVHLAQWGEQASGQGLPQAAYEIALLQVHATKIKDLSESLFIMEALCASISETEMRRHGLLVLANYYEMIVRSVVNGSRDVFQAASSRSGYPEVRDAGLTLASALQQFDEKLAGPRSAEITRIMKEIGVDPQRDAVGP